MGNERARVVGRQIGSLLTMAILVSVAIGCEPSQPAPTPAPTPTSWIVVYTATPSPTRRPSPTPRPPTATSSPVTATPTMPPTRTPATTPTVGSPSPTVSPYQLKAWVSQTNPVKGSHVTVYAELTLRGKGVVRAQVYVFCRYRALTIRYPQSGFEVTDQDGVGRVGFDTIHATPGETVIVDVYVRDSAGEHRTQTSFRPR